MVGEPLRNRFPVKLPRTALAVVATAAVALPAGAFGASSWLISSPNQVRPGVITSGHLKNGTVTLADLSPQLRRLVHQVGVAGPQGIAGPAGPTGTRGPQGVAGPQGSSGPAGTSTSGTQLGASAAISEGVNVVGTQVAPGTYRSTAADCYWARLSGFGGEIADIIANSNGPSVVLIQASDRGFESRRCGTWTRIG
jgi:hypothetical protein